MFRKATAILVIFLMLFSLCPVGANATENVPEGREKTVKFIIGQERYEVGGKSVKTDIAPYIKDVGNGGGRIMVPVAFVAPALGTEPAIWLPTERAVQIKKGNTEIRIVIDSKELLVNGKPMQMDVAAEIQDVGNGGGRTMLPIAFIARALEVGYQWNGATSSVDFYGYNKSYSARGIYGPDFGSETIEGNVVVKADGVILQNMNIKGNLEIAKEVGDGDVTLNNITVQGETFIRGGGKDSIHINGGQYANVLIENVGNQVRVVATDVNGLQVVISENAAGEEVILEGSFANLTVNAPGTTVTLKEGTSIGQVTIEKNATNATVVVNTGAVVDKMIIDGEADIKGQGTVKEATINTDGITFEKAPEKQTIASTVETAPVVNPPASSGGGGGGGGDDTPTTIAVSAISVEVVDGEAEITDDGGTLQLKANVTPTNASNKNVTWSVDDPRIATIDQTGLLTAVADGTITVMATAKDGSGKKGELVVEISGQSAVIVTSDGELATALANSTKTTIILDGDEFNGFTITRGMKIVGGTIKVESADNIPGAIPKGIYIKTNEKVEIVGVEFVDGDSEHGQRKGIVTESGYTADVTISGCTFADLPMGVYFNPTAKGTIDGNIFTRMGYAAIGIDSQGEVTISNNEINNTPMGVEIFGDNVIVEGNNQFTDVETEVWRYNEAIVTTDEELATALANSTKTTIILDGDEFNGFTITRGMKIVGGTIKVESADNIPGAIPKGIYIKTNEKVEIVGVEFVDGDSEHGQRKGIVTESGYTADVTISGCTFADLPMGVYFNPTAKGTIDGNIFTRMGYAAIGIDSQGEVTISNNEINNTPMGVEIFGDNVIVEGNNQFTDVETEVWRYNEAIVTTDEELATALANSTKTTIILDGDEFNGFTITRGMKIVGGTIKVESADNIPGAIPKGIYIKTNEKVEIVGVEFVDGDSEHGQRKGIVTESGYTADVTISGCTFADLPMGVYFNPTAKGTIDGNIFTRMGYAAIGIDSQGEVTISNNEINNTPMGVEIFGDNVIVEGNNQFTDVETEVWRSHLLIDANKKDARANLPGDSDDEAIGVEYKVLYIPDADWLEFLVRAIGEPISDEAELAYLVINVADSQSMIGDMNSSFKRGAFIVQDVGDSTAVAGGEFIELIACDDWYVLSLPSADFADELGIIVTAATKKPARYVENTLYYGGSLNLDLR